MSSIEELSRPTAAVALAIRREIQRREHAKSYKSLLFDKKHPISDLMKPRRYKVYYGGRGAVKSWGFAEALIRYADAPVGTYIDKPERILCTREYQNSIKDSVHRLLCDTITRMGLDHRFDVTDKSISNKFTDSAFLFKGLHHNVEGIKSTEGITKCWVEEAQTTSEDSWQTLIPTIRGESDTDWEAEIWVSFNVTDEEAPTHVRFVNPENRPPNSFVHLINYDQNPFLPKVLRDEMEFLKKKDPDAYRHVWLGMAKKISDAIIFGKNYVIEGFSDTLWQDAIREGGRLHYGLDHGFAKDPYALTRSFIYRGQLHIEYEAFGVGVEFAGNMSADGRGELEQLLDSVPGTREWPIKADNSRPETISFLRNKGFNVEAAEKWKGCVEDGIAHIKGLTPVKIHSRCKHMQEEARLYSFKKDRITGEILPIIVDSNNHGWDSVRYSLDGYIQQSGELALWAKLGRTQ